MQELNSARVNHLAKAILERDASAGVVIAGYYRPPRF